MSKFILDSSALLALIQKENGWEKVSGIIDESLISTINFSEAISKLFQHYVPEAEIENILKNLNLKFVNFDKFLAFESGKLIKKTQQFGLSFGDRACIATGISMNLKIVTADKIWSKLDLPIKIIMIR